MEALGGGEFLMSEVPLYQSTEVAISRRSIGYHHIVDFEGFAALKSRGLRDQFCTTSGPQVIFVRQVDF